VFTIAYTFNFFQASFGGNSSAVKQEDRVLAESDVTQC